MKKIQSKMQALECLQQFFTDAQGQITQESGGIWLKFELIQALMYVIVTCKNKEDLIINGGARVFTIFLPL